MLIAIAFTVKSLLIKSPCKSVYIISFGLREFSSYVSCLAAATSIGIGFVGICAVENLENGIIFFIPIEFAICLANSIPSPITIKSISLSFLPRKRSLTTPPTT